MDTYLFQWGTYATDNKFGAVLNNNLVYEPNHAKTANFWYQSGLFINEITVATMFIIFRPEDLIEWWPRTVRAGW